MTGFANVAAVAFALGACSALADTLPLFWLSDLAFLLQKNIDHKVYFPYVALMRCSFSIYQDMKQPKKTNLWFGHENA